MSKGVKTFIVDNEATETITLIDSLPGPLGVAFFNNNLYIANINGNSITELIFNPDGSTTASTFVSTNLSGPFGITFDSNGNLFVANSVNSTITKTENGITNVFATLEGFVRYLTFDQNGNLFVSSDNKIIKITIDENGNPTSIVEFLSIPTQYDGDDIKIFGLTFDNDGNLFYSVQNTTTSAYFIYKTIIDTSGNIVNTYLIANNDSPIYEPTALAFNSQGDLFCSNRDYITKTIVIIENIITVAPLFDKTLGNIPFNLETTSLNTNYAEQPLLYSSDAESVATVEQNGLVTLHGAGTAIITISQNEGSGYTSATTISTIDVQASEPINPTIIDTGFKLEYFMETTAQYGEITNSVQITSDLIATNQKTLVINDASVTIIKDNLSD